MCVCVYARFNSDDQIPVFLALKSQLWQSFSNGYGETARHETAEGLAPVLPPVARPAGPRGCQISCRTHGEVLWEDGPLWPPWEHEPARGCEGVTWVHARGMGVSLRKVCPSIYGNLKGEDDDQQSNVCGCPGYPISRQRPWVKECNPIMDGCCNVSQKQSTWIMHFFEPRFSLAGRVWIQNNSMKTTWRNDRHLGSQSVARRLVLLRCKKRLLTVACLDYV